MNIICKFFTGMDQIVVGNSNHHSKKNRQKNLCYSKIELIVNWPD